MAEHAPPQDLIARVRTAAGDGQPTSRAAAAATRLRNVLDLIAAGRGVREDGLGSNAAALELLVVDALLTDAAAAAVRARRLDEVLRALDLEALAERARAIDEGRA